MSGETVDVYGASSWQVVGTSVSCSAGGYTQISASNTIKSLMAATEEDMSSFDIRIQVATTTPTIGNTLQVLLRPKADGANESPAPGSGWARTPVGYVTLKNAIGYYYGFMLRNLDKEATFYIYSNEATNALTLTVSVRMRALKVAA